jgi:hypothetical protein
MTGSGIVPGTADELPAVRVFELARGSEYAVFFAAREEDLPNENVRAELRALARRNRNAATRGVVDVVITDAVSGLIGGAAWAAVTKALVATTSYVRSRRVSSPVVDEATLSIRLETASMKILMEVPPSLTSAQFERLDDGRWSAGFTYQGDSIRIAADPGATVVTWTRKPGAHPVDRTGSQPTRATVVDSGSDSPVDLDKGGS